MYCLCRCVLCIVCNCVQYYCHRVASQLQLMYHIRHLNDQGSCRPRYARWVPQQCGFYPWPCSWIHSWHYSCEWNHLENCALQGCYTASSCNSLSTFWGNLSVPHIEGSIIILFFHFCTTSCQLQLIDMVHVTNCAATADCSQYSVQHSVGESGASECYHTTVGGKCYHTAVWASVIIQQCGASVIIQQCGASVIVGQVLSYSSVGQVLYSSVGQVLSYSSVGPYHTAVRGKCYHTAV